MQGWQSVSFVDFRGAVSMRNINLFLNVKSMLLGLSGQVVAEQKKTCLDHPTSFSLRYIWGYGN